MNKRKIEVMSHINKPQKTTVLGFTGIFGQLFNSLSGVQVGEFIPYFLSLTYGDILTMISPIIIFI